MPFNGSGIFSVVRQYVNDKINGILVTASRVDDNFNDVADGLSTCITRDGQTEITNNIPMNNFRITELGTPVVRTDAMSLGAGQDGLFCDLGTTGGSVNAYTVTPSLNLTSYKASQRFIMEVHITNTSASTLDINGLGADNLGKFNGDGGITTLEEGDLIGGQKYDIVRSSDNTQFAVLNPQNPLINVQQPIEYYKDQSGTQDIYGVLSGSIDGVNTTFTVSQGAYISGTLTIYLNGQLQHLGATRDWQETDPITGTFDFNTPPIVGDRVYVEYGKPSPTTFLRDDSNSSDIYGWSSNRIKTEIDSKLPDQIVYVSSASDLPTPTDIGDGFGLAIHLENKYYVFVNTTTLVLTYPLVVSSSGVIIVGATKQYIAYAGSGAFIRSTATGGGFTMRQVLLLNTGTASVFSATFSSFTVSNLTFINFTSVGTITCSTYFDLSSLAILDTGVSVSEGLTIIGTSAVTSTLQLAIIDIKYTGILTGVDKIHFKIEGAWSNISIANISVSPKNGESVFFIDPSLNYNNISMFSGGVRPLNGSTGQAFYPTSLNQTSKNLYVTSIIGVPDSTTTAELLFENNSTVTVINTVDTPTPLALSGIVTGGGSEERIVFQDLVTFDSGTNLITTPFTHEMATDDEITFFPAPLAIPAQSITVGTLPTEIIPNKTYYVIADTATTFSISETRGGSQLNFTDNGTGTNYVRHNTGKTDGWLINVGNEVSLHIDGFMVIDSVVSQSKQYRAVMMKSTADLTIGTLSQNTNGGVATVSNNVVQSSVISRNINLKNNEGMLFYIKGITDATNVVVKDLQINVNLI